MNESRVFVYFKMNCHGYELKGDTITSGWEAFMNRPDTYYIEYDYSSTSGGMHFFVYEWDKSKNTKKSIFDEWKKQDILLSMKKYVDLPEDVSNKIFEDYLKEELDLEMQANS